MSIGKRSRLTIHFSFDMPIADLFAFGLLVRMFAPSTNNPSILPLYMSSRMALYALGVSYFGR